MKLPFLLPRDLRALGVLGMNRRNAEFILPGNPRHHYPRVDDKLLTKQLCESHGIPVPKTYAILEYHSDLRQFRRLVAAHSEFVIKPCKGAQGRGIVVVASHSETTFTTSGGETWTWPDLHYHLETILAGLYSLGGQPDRALVEQRIVPHPIFLALTKGGTPDIRVILYRHAPVMAMARLPTRASRGRANLHQGAVGAGIELESGQFFGGVCRDRAVTVHPDTGAPVAGLVVPQWKELLAVAVRLAKVLELNYLGVDFVLDAERGPVVLEANARPGLAIQIANRAGLLPRLRELDRGTGVSPAVST